MKDIPAIIAAFNAECQLRGKNGRPELFFLESISEEPTIEENLRKQTRTSFSRYPRVVALRPQTHSWFVKHMSI